MIKTNLAILLILTNAFFAYSQEEIISEVITLAAEEMVSHEDESGRSELYQELLDDLAENPVQVNSADVSEISRLFFLTGFQVKALADYVTLNGPVQSLYELANIPGFDRESAVQVFPFITLAGARSGEPLTGGWTNTLLTNFSVRTQADNASYPGPSFKLLSKYKFSSGKISGGLILEKDAGEKFLSGSPTIPDFLSANLVYTGQGFFRKIIIGDFSARFGQGTNLNTGFRTSLPVTNAGFILSRDEIKSYTSTDENNFFRGIAVATAMNRMALTVFASGNRIDATTGSTTGSSPDHIISFYRGGLHNTESLLSKKDAVKETCYGINLSYNLRNTKVGVTFSEVRFSLPVMTDATKPEDIFDPAGKIYRTGSVYYNHIFRRIHFSGEYSLNGNMRSAFVQSLALRPSDRLTISVIYRDYSPGYFSFHSGGPGSSSSTSNARGLYGSFTLELARRLFLSAGCDSEHYPWLRYRCSAPSHGIREEVKLKYMPANNLTLEGIYSHRQSMYNMPDYNGIPVQYKASYNNIRGVVIYSPLQYLTLRSRIDYKMSFPKESSGTLLLQDIVCRFRRVPVSFWFRFCVFNTADWDSRLYTYENDLLYSFSIPALYGKGSRSYLMIKWEIREFAVLRIKYGITSKTEGPEKVTSSEELKIQLIVRM